MSTDDWMRPDDWKKLSARRMEKARETLEEARLMAEHEHWRACINRLYYACFYAVGALLASKALSSKTHSGTRSLFAQHFVKPGLISKDHADFYDMLFDQRQRGDYEDFFDVDSAAVRPWLPRAEAFVKAVARQIEKIS